MAIKGIDPIIFQGLVSDIALDLNKPVRDVEAELFQKKVPKEDIDRLEQQLGLSPVIVKLDVKYKNILLNLADEEDKALLNELMNEKEKYNIILWKDSWTQKGDYKLFVIYTEQAEK